MLGFAAAWSMIRKNFVSAAVVLGLMALAALWFGFQHERARADREATRATWAALDAAVAKGQGAVTEKAAVAVERADSRALNITVKAEEAARHVAEAPGADTPVPDAVLAGWSLGLRELRDEARAAGPGVPDNPGGAGPAGALSAAGGRGG